MRMLQLKLASQIGIFKIYFMYNELPTLAIVRYHNCIYVTLDKRPPHLI
jgi:hypothetical protein